MKVAFDTSCGWRFLGFTLLWAVATPVLAAGTTGTVRGRAVAEAVVPISAVNLRGLDFGTIIASGTAGTISIAADGTITYSGGTRPMCSASTCSSGHPASFAMAGEPGSSFSISLPPHVIAYGTAPDGAALPELVVDDMVARSITARAMGSDGRLDAKGKDQVDVGGRIRIPASVRAGHYRATFTLAVNYP